MTDEIHLCSFFFFFLVFFFFFSEVLKGSICIRLQGFLLFLQREAAFVTSCLLSWPMQPFQKGVYSCGKEFAHMGANSFLYEMIPICMGSNKEDDRVVSPIHLKLHYIP